MMSMIIWDWLLARLLGRPVFGAAAWPQPEAVGPLCTQSALCAATASRASKHLRSTTAKVGEIGTELSCSSLSCSFLSSSCPALAWSCEVPCNFASWYYRQLCLLVCMHASRLQNKSHLKALCSRHVFEPGLDLQSSSAAHWNLESWILALVFCECCIIGDCR